jgi:glucokinase
MKRTTRARRVNRGESWVIGVDVGATNVRAGFVHARSGELRHLQVADTGAKEGKRHSLQQLALVVEQAVCAARTSRLAATRVGIGIPELVSNSGEIDTHCSLAWRSADVRALLGRYGEVTITSDVRAAALAEARLGAGRSTAAFLLITVGTGVSSTLVINGTPFAGAHGHAISFASGPTYVDSTPEGGRRFEALESRVAGPGLLRRAQELGSTEHSPIAVGRKARQGPGVERTAVDEAAAELAVHVALIANTLDPALIVVSGGLGSHPGRYWQTFRSALRRHLWGPHARRLPICRARLGPHAGVIGAALSAAELT